MTEVCPILRGNANMPSTRQRLFANLGPLTDGTILHSMPDSSYEARPGQLDRRIQEVLSSSVVLFTNQSAPILPNIRTKGKGPRGDWIVAQQ